MEIPRPSGLADPTAKCNTFIRRYVKYKMYAPRTFEMMINLVSEW